MEGQTQKQKIDINVVMARSFINTIQFALQTESVGPILAMADPMSAMRFRVLTDAQLSVLYSLGTLVTDRAAVMAEFDKMLNMLIEKSQDKNGPSIVAMREGRQALTDLLSQTDRGH